MGGGVEIGLPGSRAPTRPLRWACHYWALVCLSCPLQEATHGQPLALRLSRVLIPAIRDECEVPDASLMRVWQEEPCFRWVVSVLWITMAFYEV